MIFQKTFASLFLFALATIIQAQEFQWVESAGWRGDESINAIATDNDGYVYLTGYCDNDVEIGGYTTENMGILTIKYDSDGNLIWAKESGGSHQCNTNAIVCDHNNNVIITGYHDGTISFGGITLQSSAGTNMFLVKYSPEGDVKWAKTFKTVIDVHDVIGRSVDIDSNNNIYVSGDFNGTVVFNWTQLVSNQSNKSNNSDIFLTKFDTTGYTIWAKRAGGIDDDIGRDILIDKDNSVCLSGQYNPLQADFDTINIHDPSGGRAFVAKYSDLGNILWLSYARRIESGYSQSYKISIDSKGNIYSFGNYAIGIYWGNDSISEGTNYLAKIDQNGIPVFLKSISTNIIASSINRKGDIVVGQDDDVYLTSNFLGTLYWGDISLESYIHPTWGSVADIFVAKLNDIGYPQWAVKAGGTYVDWALCISSHDSTVYTGGSYCSQFAIFGNDTVNNNSWNDDGDLFIAANIDITPNKCPDISPVLSSEKPNLCVGDSVLITCEYEYGNEYQWMSDDSILSIQYEKSYYVYDSIPVYVITNPGSQCPDTSNVLKLAEYALPDISLTAHPDTIACPGELTTLYAQKGEDYSYLWFDEAGLLEGEIGDSLNVYSAGIYTVLANDGHCDNSMSIQIWPNFVPLATIYADPDTIFCNEEPAYLYTSNSASNEYYWYLNGVEIFTNTSVIEISESGSYEVVVIGDSCQNTGQVDIVAHSTPVITYPFDTIFVPSFPYTLNIGEQNGRVYWFKGNESIPMCIGEVMEFNQPGKYRILVHNHCGNTEQNLWVFDESYGIGDEGFDNNGLRVFPNPSNNKIFIETDTREKINEVIIYNATGEQIIAYYKPSASIDISSLEKGLYIVLIRTEIRIHRSKLVVQ